jgi:hypothetical protein
MRRALLAAFGVLLTAVTAHAQAWLPSKGEVTVSLLFYDPFVSR